jgi:hypothetical protein
MKDWNWTTIIVCVVLVGGFVAITLAGKEIPDELKATYVALSVILAGALKSALEKKLPAPPPAQ